MATPFVNQGIRAIPAELRRAMWDLVGIYLQENPIPQVITFGGDLSGEAMTAIPAAERDFPTGSTRARCKADLTGHVQARLTSAITTAGPAGSYLKLLYSTDDTNWVEAGSPDAVQLSIASTGTLVSAWFALAPDARGDVFLRLVTGGGDGVANPAAGLTTAQVR